MTPIKKIREACFLACIESFLKDNGIIINQECMISVLSNLGLCSNTGIVNNGEEDKACKLFNIIFYDVPYHFPVEDKYTDGSLLIGTTIINRHCMRFWKQEEESKIIVMDPDRGEFIYFDKKCLEKMGPKYHRIELQVT